MTDITVKVQTYYGEEYTHTYRIASFEALVSMLDAKGSAIIDVIVR